MREHDNGSESTGSKDRRDKRQRDSQAPFQIYPKDEAHPSFSLTILKR